MKQTGAVLVTLPEVAAYCSRYDIPYNDRGGTVHSGGSAVQKNARIYAVNAIHSSDIMGKEYCENNQVMPGSGTCGMVMVPEDGWTVYFSGDTGFFGDMALMRKLYRPKISVLPIGGKHTMGVREAACAMELLGSDILIPGHFNTFPGQEADTDELINHVSVRAPQAKVVLLKPRGAFSM